MKFDIDTPVRFTKTNSEILDGRTGVIHGATYQDGFCSFYIVHLDTPIETGAQKGYRSIQMIEFCLEPA